MLHQRARLLGSAFGLVTAGALVAACGGGPPAEQPGSPAPTQAASPKQTTGTFEPYRQGATAITYDPAQVPPGSGASITSERMDGRTRVTVGVRGLQPNREYGAHVHTKPCGPTGEDAGPHFQERADPVKPSVDPAYANPQNEVWLDFHTDAQGNGTATAEGNWSFDTRQDAKSFVIHAMGTHTEPGQAGTAGARLACLDATF
ncbi:superoxide dismutase family protein [Saccharopolyspora sp. K220]|uniref:superoxide dismutase family protein n=1 Tax=Saccharopolyspora soli TaxID=2926618 RepID=UPI001F599CF5|nr:superoxide dismutase family protein [Saccharopolyspora soli]MCI2419700.1 superoxide dismutase family protein [Saccharopolyspora soli]